VRGHFGFLANALQPPQLLGAELLGFGGGEREEGVEIVSEQFFEEGEELVREEVLVELGGLPVLLGVFPVSPDLIIRCARHHFIIIK